jgi:hypothetical protein
MAEGVTAEPVARERLQNTLLHPARHSEAAEDRLLVRLVSDAKARLEIDALAELAQDLGAKTMDRPTLHAINAIAQLVVQPLGNLSGRLVRKSENADPGRVNCQVLDQEPDALDEAEGLAGAGTRDNEEGLRLRFDGGALARRWSARNTSGAGLDRRRISDERFIRERGLGRARGGDRQVSVVR